MGHALASVNFGHSLARVKILKGSTPAGAKYGLPNKLIWVGQSPFLELVSGPKFTELFSSNARERLQSITCHSDFRNFDPFQRHSR